MFSLPWPVPAVGDGRPPRRGPAEYFLWTPVGDCHWVKGHDCPLFRLPGTRPDFWRDKIRGNRERDKRLMASLVSHEWRGALVWECASHELGARPEQVIGQLAGWLETKQPGIEVRGRRGVPCRSISEAWQWAICARYKPTGRAPTSASSARRSHCTPQLWVVTGAEIGLF